MDMLNQHGLPWQVKELDGAAGFLSRKALSPKGRGRSMIMETRAGDPGALRIST
jgi:hypothetical protein